MSNFDPNMWANTSADTSGNGDDNPPPEPGHYEAVLVDAKAWTAAKSGDDTMKLVWQIATGTRAGYTFDELFSFAPNRIEVTKKTAAKLGMNHEGITSIQDFDARLKPLIGNWYGLEVVQNGDFRNVYVRAQVTPGPVSDTTPAGATDEFHPAPVSTGAQDDVPF